MCVTTTRAWQHCVCTHCLHSTHLPSKCAHVVFTTAHPHACMQHLVSPRQSYRPFCQVADLMQDASVPQQQPQVRGGWGEGVNIFVLYDS